MILRFCSGSSTPASRSRKRSAASTWTSGTPKWSRKAVDHLLGLVLAQQAVVDEHAGEPVAERAVDDQRRDRRVDAAGEPADRPAVADLRADRVDLLVDHRRGRPALLAAADVARKRVEDLGPVRGVDDLGVELDPVEAALGVLQAATGDAGWRPAR